VKIPRGIDLWNAIMFIGGIAIIWSGMALLALSVAIGWPVFK